MKDLGKKLPGMMSSLDTQSKRYIRVLSREQYANECEYNRSNLEMEGRLLFVELTRILTSCIHPGAFEGESIALA